MEDQYKIDFIYWRQFDGVDGIIPFDYIVFHRLQNFYINGKYSHFLIFPVEFIEQDIYEYSIAVYALLLARKFASSKYYKHYKLGNLNNSVLRKEVEKFKFRYVYEKLLGNSGNVSQTAREMSVNRKTIQRILGQNVIDGVKNDRTRKDRNSE